MRDYNTGRWEGGNPDCKHRVGGQVEDNKAPDAITTGQRPGVDAGSCRECGAKRIDSQIGLEQTPDQYVAEMVEVFRELRRVLRDDGTVWLNLGDSYSSGYRTTSPQQTLRAISNKQLTNFENVRPVGMRRKGSGRADGIVTDESPRNRDGAPPTDIPGKNLIGIPWRVAFALQADGWYLRQDIIWAKPNPMPESVTDRCTKAHEYIFLLTKNERYFFDADAIAEPVVKTGTPGHLTPGAGSYQNERHTPQYKTPDGWDTSTGNGSHGSFHRNGREAGKVGYKSKKAAKHGNGAGRVDIDNHPSGGWAQGEASRNKRDVWTVATQPFPEAHFATFPPALIEPCIKAGTSEKGCCSKCGSPWRRDVGPNEIDDSRPLARQNINDPSVTKLGQGTNAQSSKTWGHYLKGKPTLGWSPTCQCENAEIVPCTVLDPFGGAGTTGLVADRLGRDATLVELNPEYAAMIKRRLFDDAGMFASVVAEEEQRDAEEA